MWRDNWWWKLLSGAFIRDRVDKTIKYFAELPNINNPYSSHRTINLCWGLGSFFGFWIDHFLYHRGGFSNWELSFILAMAGIHTTSALVAKRFGLNSNHEDLTAEGRNASANKSGK